MIEISADDDVHICGNSLTDENAYRFWDGPGGLFARLRGPYESRSTGPESAVVGRTPTLTQFGLSGSTLAQAIAAFSTRVTPFSPTVLITELGTNEVVLGTTAAAFLASFDTWLALCDALNPSMQHMLIGVGPVAGELWAEGTPPTFTGNPYDAAIETFNTDVAAGIPARVQYVPIRPACALFQRARNAPAPGVSQRILTVDGTHPNREMKALMADEIMKYITVVA